MQFQWGDKLLHSSPTGKNVEVLFLSYSSPDNHALVMEKGNSLTSHIVHLSTLKPLTPENQLTYSFYKGSLVEFEGEEFQFDVEYSTTYVIGSRDKSLRDHELYYGSIYEMNYLLVEKDKVRPLNLKNGNMKHLLQN